MLKMLNSIWGIVPALSILTGLLGGCAQTTVQPQFQQGTAGPMPRPSQVVVFPLAVNPAQVTENRGFIQGIINNMGSTTTYQRQESTGEDAANAFADALVTKINAMGLPAWKLQPGASVPVN